jgi:hypothetical protein
MKLSCLVLILFVLIACDPADRRMKVHNLSDEYIYYLYSKNDSLIKEHELSLFELFTKEVDGVLITDTAFSNRVSPNTLQIVSYNSNWENDIKAYPDQKIKFFIFEKTLLENFRWEKIVKDQIYSKKYSLSVEELKEQNWTIVYP